MLSQNYRERNIFNDVAEVVFIDFHELSSTIMTPMQPSYIVVTMVYSSY